MCLWYWYFGKWLFGYGDWRLERKRRASSSTGLGVHREVEKGEVFEFLKNCGWSGENSGVG